MSPNRPTWKSEPRGDGSRFKAQTQLTLRVDEAELNKPVVETLFIWERVTK